MRCVTFVLWLLVEVIARGLPLLAQQERTDNARRQTDTTDNGCPEKTLLGDLVIDELTEIRCLEVSRFLLEQVVVEAAGFSVVAELVVS